MPQAGASPTFKLVAGNQGCADKGLCYPPMTKVVFPTTSSSAAASSLPPYPWETIAILGGAFAFLVAGLILRKGRRLDLPA